jgi:hypothetical protein
MSGIYQYGAIARFSGFEPVLAGYHFFKYLTRRVFCKMKISVKHQDIQRLQIPDVWKVFRLAYYNLHISAKLTSYEFS